MARRGELETYPGRITPVNRFIKRLLQRIGGCEVKNVIADRFRKAEAEQYLAEGGVKWEIEFRGYNSGMEASADIVSFQTEVLEGNIFVHESLAMNSAITESYIDYGKTGLPFLAKQRRRGRIDILQAVVLAVAAGRRWRLPTVGEDTRMRDFYESRRLDQIVVAH